jgi:diguanylate cyclase (GGDEF)-like protein
MDEYPSGTHSDSDGLWDWNLAANRIHFSPRWISQVGAEDHQIGNTPDEWLQRVHPDDLEQVLRHLDAARANGSRDFSFRHRLRHRDGTYRWMACRGLAVLNDAGDVVRLTGSHSDVTAETVTDSTTGLPNQLLLVDRLSRSIELARRYEGFHFGLLFIDVGRPAGLMESKTAARDPLLTAAARRLETCLRIGDSTATLRDNDFVARLHGDQFAVLLDGLKDVSHAKGVADRILEQLLVPLHVGDRDVYLSASIGIAVSATGYSHADDALRDADIALHRARVLGGSHCEVFDTAILKSEQTELQLEGDFTNALERGEFEIFYQPIVALGSATIVGFEALARWHHPVLGLVSPADFIPVAERTGFIVPLGNWILREACLRLKSWQGALPLSPDSSMSVNLSSVQLRDPALISQVSEALRDSGLEPRCLVLELTESIAMENPTAGKTLLMQLRALGVRISIDDFGTGYSSLSSLRELPVDALKVDQSFVRGMERRQSAADIVATMMSMARQLGVHVVAEGVENEEQLALLQSLRCDAAQGYLFAKPLDVGRAENLIRSGVTLRSRRKPSAATHLPNFTDVKVDRTAPTPVVIHRNAFTFLRPLAIAAMLILVASAGTVWTLTVDVRGAMPASPSLFHRSTVVPPFARSEAGASPARNPQLRIPRLTSLNVSHLHRFGSCEGRLLVSAERLVFAPDNRGDDGFTLKHSEYLQALDNDQLIIKSNDRTYRFKAIGVVGTADRRGPLQLLSGTIQSLR